MSEVYPLNIPVVIQSLNFWLFNFKGFFNIWLLFPNLLFVIKFVIFILINLSIKPISMQYANATAYLENSVGYKTVKIVVFGIAKFLY